MEDQKVTKVISRDEFFAVANRHEDVALESREGMVVRLQVWTSEDKLKLQKEALDLVNTEGLEIGEGGEVSVAAGNIEKGMEMKKFLARIAAASIVDSDGNKMFAEGEEEKFLGFGADVVDEICEHVVRINKFTPEARGEAEKKSEAATETESSID